MKFSVFSGLFTVALSTSAAFAAPTASTTATDLEARQGGAEAAAEVIGLVVDIAKGIIDQINQDKLDRSEFTQQTVNGMHDKNGDFNYVICHTDHEYHWDGQEGQDWAHSHQEFDIQVGGTIGYEIYTARSGSFTLKGDGGYLNWAYNGYVVSDQPGESPRTVVFKAP